MNLETALNWVEDAVTAKAQRRLLPAEVVIFKGTWQGMTYEQMANSSSYGTNYLMRDIGPKFWKLLSNILGENVGKNNLRLVLENLSAFSVLRSERLAEINNLNQAQLAQYKRDRQVPFELPSHFYGRERQLNLLRQWIGVDKCRLIGIWGLNGVGKTVLMQKLVQEIKSEFELVIWRSAIEALTSEELVRELLPSSLATRASKLARSSYGCLVEFRKPSLCLLLYNTTQLYNYSRQQADVGLGR